MKTIFWEEQRGNYIQEGFMNKLNEFILNVLILILIITSNIEHFASNVTFFIKQFGFVFPHIFSSIVSHVS